MSLNWEWNSKMGECVYKSGHTDNLYQGNAFVIAIHEFPDDTYQLAWFACDEIHMKNMMGLSKGYEENDFQYFGIEKLRLNTNYRNTGKLVNLLVKSKTKITIELYAEVQDDAQ